MTNIAGIVGWVSVALLAALVLMLFRIMWIIYAIHVDLIAVRYATLESLQDIKNHMAVSRAGNNHMETISGQLRFLNERVNYLARSKGFDPEWRMGPPSWWRPGDGAL